MKRVSLVLDLLRHGEAAPDPHDDALRRLTARGEHALRELGERLARDGWRPDRVFASPYARAQDSAGLVVHAAGLTIEIETLKELEPEVRASRLLETLDELGVTGEVMLVGHQPQMSRLAHRLAGVEIEFRPGDLVRIARGKTGSAGRIVLRIPATRDTGA